MLSQLQQYYCQQMTPDKRLVNVLLFLFSVSAVYRLGVCHHAGPTPVNMGGRARRTGGNTAVSARTHGRTKDRTVNEVGGVIVIIVVFYHCLPHHSYHYQSFSL
jgi:hypothetical protein